MELAPIAEPKPIMRLGRDEYSGLHRRYADLLGNPLLLKQGNDIPEHLRQKLLQRFRNMMRALFTEKGDSLRIEILAEKPAQDFIRTHTDTLDSAFRQVGMSHTMRQQLSRSNYVFSGLKTFHELNEAFPSLLDENGNRKTFERFLKDVQKIDQTYNRNYLRAEYNFVHASAGMAARWEEFARDGDDYLLQYRTAGDGKVRPEHAALNGVTLPPSDTFWDEYYPPNGWNCRCTAVQVRKGKYTETPRGEAMERGKEALAGDKKGMFRFNPGKQRKAVPDYNPYTTSRCRDCDIAKGKDRANEGKTKLAFSLPSAAGLRGSKAKLARKFIPDNELCQACQLLRQCEQNQESSYKYGKGEVHISHLVNPKDTDYMKLVQIAEYFAKDGATATLTPKMSRPSKFRYNTVYADLIGTKYEGKCPDLNIDGKWYEHEGFTSENPKRALKNMLNHGLKQSNRLIIDRPELAEWYIMHNIITRVKNGQDIQEVWLREKDGSLKRLYVKESEE